MKSFNRIKLFLLLLLTVLVSIAFPGVNKVFADDPDVSNTFTINQSYQDYNGSVIQSAPYYHPSYVATNGTDTLYFDEYLGGQCFVLSDIPEGVWTITSAAPSNYEFIPSDSMTIEVDADLNIVSVTYNGVVGDKYSVVSDDASDYQVNIKDISNRFLYSCSYYNTNESPTTSHNVTITAVNTTDSNTIVKENVTYAYFDNLTDGVWTITQSEIEGFTPLGVTTVVVEGNHIISASYDGPSYDYSGCGRNFNYLDNWYIGVINREIPVFQNELVINLIFENADGSHATIYPGGVPSFGLFTSANASSATMWDRNQPDPFRHVFRDIPEGTWIIRQGSIYNNSKYGYQKAGTITVVVNSDLEITSVTYNGIYADDMTVISDDPNDYNVTLINRTNRFELDTVFTDPYGNVVTDTPDYTYTITNGSTSIPMSRDGSTFYVNDLTDGIWRIETEDFEDYLLAESLSIRVRGGKIISSSYSGDEADVDMLAVSNDYHVTLYRRSALNLANNLTIHVTYYDPFGQEVSAPNGFCNFYINANNQRVYFDSTDGVDYEMYNIPAGTYELNPVYSGANYTFNGFSNYIYINVDNDGNITSVTYQPVYDLDNSDFEISSDDPRDFVINLYQRDNQILIRNTFVDPDGNSINESDSCVYSFYQYYHNNHVDGWPNTFVRVDGTQDYLNDRVLNEDRGTTINYIQQDQTVPGYIPFRDILRFSDNDLNITIQDNSNVTIDDNGTPHPIINIVNVQTRVSIESIDEATGEILPGANIQVLYVDSNNNEVLVAEWESDSSAHNVDGLVVGTTYILRTNGVPSGYLNSVDTTFVIADDGSIDVDNTSTSIDGDVLQVEIPVDMTLPPTTTTTTTTTASTTTTTVPVTTTTTTTTVPTTTTTIVPVTTTTTSAVVPVTTTTTTVAPTTTPSVPVVVPTTTTETSNGVLPLAPTTTSGTTTIAAVANSNVASTGERNISFAGIAAIILLISSMMFVVVYRKNQED